MAREQFLTSTWDETNGSIEFQFKGAPELGVVKFETAQLPDDIRLAGMLHGFEQKLRDKVAGQLKDMGKQKFAEYFKGTVADHVAQFAAGEWNAKGESDGTPRVGLLMRAIARVRNVTVEKAKEWYAAQPDNVKKGIATVDSIKTAKDAIKAEDAARKPVAAPAADVLAALDSLGA